MVLLFVTFLTSCKEPGLSGLLDVFYKREKVLYLTTMGPVSPEKVKDAARVIEKFYGFRVKNIGGNKLPEEAYCSGRKRYVALRVLDHLKGMDPGDLFHYNYKVLALTEKDIETEDGNVHWGVMGLAFLGGDEGIVSGFRMKARFRKVVLHEVGHMLGVDHCSFEVTACFMNDAKGKGTIVDRTKFYLCDGCRDNMSF
ncbi:hypothetical protein DC20_02845 [Rufibacter tibetensis]|uniref:Peptidase M54 n=1 Tax=Rufibacter tibetensis TaxID=512763 RepID=A0A0P0C4N4_9BACT|nr:hypothetical protein DC20_02845 [Rufibacter tibetensis]